MRQRSGLRSLIIGFFLLSSCFLSSKEIPSVLIVGNGFMGVNHLKNLEMLQEENLVRVAGIVDSDSNRLKNLSYLTFTDLHEACQKLDPDIVVVASNTKTHFDVIQTILNSCKKEKLPALFIEKPLVETSEQARELIQILENEGYPKHHPIICGYLFRFSPIVEEAIRYVKHHNLTIEGIEVRWQKQRVPTRPSAGVHMDEATHPIDLILNFLLPELGIAAKPVSLSCLSRKWDASIIDKKQQQSLYADQPEKLLPLAEVEFEMNIANLTIHSLSSFMRPPQIREVALNCSRDTKIVLSYDKDQTDQLMISKGNNTLITKIIERPNKLLTEWRAFIDYYQTGNTSAVIPTLQDMLEDIRITEMLENLPLKN